MNKVQGWSDTPLTPRGIKIARLLGKCLKNIDFVAAYSRDNGRAGLTVFLVSLALRIRYPLGEQLI